MARIRVGVRVKVKVLIIVKADNNYLKYIIMSFYSMFKIIHKNFN